MEAVRVGYLVWRGAIFGRKEARPMGDLRVDAPNSPPVVSPEEMAGRFSSELIGAMPDWKRRLGEDPSRLAELEHEVRDAFSRGADSCSDTRSWTGVDHACPFCCHAVTGPPVRGRAS